MSSKTDTEVIIGGKVFTLSGYESEEYLQKVASYINNKVNEYSKVDSFRRQPLDTQSVLLQLNIADDYFKAKRQINILEEELQRKEKELYDLKHELISSQIKMENMEKDSREMEIKLRENAKQIEKLERNRKIKSCRCKAAFLVCAVFRAKPADAQTGGIILTNDFRTAHVA